MHRFRDIASRSQNTNHALQFEPPIKRTPFEFRSQNWQAKRDGLALHFLQLHDPSLSRKTRTTEQQIDVLNHSRSSTFVAMESTQMTKKSTTYLQDAAGHTPLVRNTNYFLTVSNSGDRETASTLLANVVGR